MAESTKLVQFNQKIDPKILKEWKKSFTHDEKIRQKLEEALKDNIKKNKQNLIRELNEEK